MARADPAKSLTVKRIEDAVCPYGQTEIRLWDRITPGLLVRVRASGGKSFAVRYRAGRGRSAPMRVYTIGPCDRISLSDARRIARAKLLEVQNGGDPARARQLATLDELHSERSRLARVLDDYDRDLERRRVVKRSEIISLLRREALDGLGDVDLRDLDRPRLLQRIRDVEASGRRGTANDLRSKLAVFLNWCANEGVLQASPLAGYRRPRLSRAERLVRPGRSLEDQELGPVWRAFEASDDPVFAAYLKVLLLTGQRRTETVLMRWSDIDLEANIWSIPAETTKSGRAHKVPLPAPVLDVLAELPRLDVLVFPGRGRRPISGFTKRIKAVEAASAAAGIERWTLHDLRRSFRTGLGRLGVAPHVAELLVNHAFADDLAARYDLGDHWPPRVDAATRWAEHVAAAVEGQHHAAA